MTVSTFLQYDKQVNEWQLTVFIVSDIFRFFGPPFKVHLRFISFDIYYICQQNNQIIVFHNDKCYIRRLMIDDCPSMAHNYDFDDVSNLEISSPLKSLFQIIFPDTPTNNYMLLNQQPY